MFSLWLQKNLVRFPIAELNNFVFDGRAISRTSSLDSSRIEGGLMQIPTYDVVCLGCGACYPAGHLFYLERTAIEREYFTRRGRLRGQETESWRRFITAL